MRDKDKKKDIIDLHDSIQSKNDIKRHTENI